MISLTFWLVRSRGWENRTPTKGFGDPYHTIWPIPYKVYFIYSQNYIHVNISLRFITSCVAEWMIYSTGSLRDYVTTENHPPDNFLYTNVSVSFASQMSSLYHECSFTSKLAPSHSCYILPALSAFWSSPHPISNSQLHVLPHFHLCPIYLVVFKGVYFLTNGISHLKGGFTLRCLQRLSLPGLATRP